MNRDEAIAKFEERAEAFFRVVLEFELRKGRKLSDSFRGSAEKFAKSVMLRELPFVTDYMDYWLDTGSIRHGKGSTNPCELYKIRKDRAEAISDKVKEDIMWIYDRCVIRAVWHASMDGDKAFFKELGKAVQDHVKGKSKSRLSNNKLKSFLIRMDEVDIVDLTDGSDEEWQRAHEFLEFILNMPPKIKRIGVFTTADNWKKLKKFNKSLFTEAQKNRRFKVTTIKVPDEFFGKLATKKKKTGRKRKKPK